MILRSSDGLPLGTLGVFDHQPRELTPRQGTQLLAVARQVMALLELSRLRGEQERSRQIIDSAQDYAILATDLQGRITSWNSGAQRLLGWSSEKPSAVTWRASSAKPIAAHRSPGRNAHGAGAGACRRRTLASAQDGSRFWASGILTPLLHDGQTQGFVKILRDLTESRQQQAAARETEERYRALVDLSPQIIWQCDAAGGLTFCNSYWCEFTGLGEASSTGEGWLAAVSTSDRQRVAEQWQAALRRELPFKLELPLRDVDGNLRWFQANAAPTYDADGQLLRWVCVAQDIDSRRRSEMQRLESEAFTRLLLDSANEGFYPSTATAPLPCATTLSQDSRLRQP